MPKTLIHVRIDPNMLKFKIKDLSNIFLYLDCPGQQLVYIPLGGRPRDGAGQ